MGERSVRVAQPLLIPITEGSRQARSSVAERRYYVTEVGGSIPARAYQTLFQTHDV